MRVIHIEGSQLRKDMKMEDKYVVRRIQRSTVSMYLIMFPSQFLLNILQFIIKARSSTETVSCAADYITTIKI